MDAGEDRALLSRIAKELIKRGEYLERLAKDPAPDVTRHDIDKVLSEYKVVFLFFTADWCGPCIAFLETFRNVALELAQPGVFFGKVDVDKYYSIAEKYNIERIPAIAIFVEGSLVDVIVGSMSRSSLKSRLERYIQKAIQG